MEFSNSDFRISIEQTRAIAEAVDVMYRGLAKQSEQAAQKCDACGKCCDFESFGHRLYLTLPELIYFRAGLAEQGITVKSMTTGVCPYRVEGECSVYPWRFAGCRIFTCTGDTDLQSRLSEEAISKAKQLCLDYRLDYRYMDLKTALAII